MPNASLKGKNYQCPPELMKHLESTFRKYRGDEHNPGVKKLKTLIDSREMSYDQMKMMKSFFENNDEQGDEYTLNGGKKMNHWVEKELGKSRDAIEQVKKTRMDAGEENQFKEKHTKDKHNANPTKVRMPNIAKSSKGRNIMSNKAVYETISEEITEINYLIEYMNKNKII